MLKNISRNLIDPNNTQEVNVQQDEQVKDDIPVALRMSQTTMKNPMSYADYDDTQ